MKPLLGIFLLFCLSCHFVAGDSVVTQWNTLMLNSVMKAKTAPPVFSRILFMVHEAMYDAWAVYDPVALGSRFSGTLKRPASENTIENKNKAMCYAAYTVFNDLYPQFKADSSDLMISLGYDPTIVKKDFITPEGIGNTVGFCIVDNRHGDGSNQLGDMNGGSNYTDYTNYTTPNTPTQLNDPNQWQPLIVNGVQQKYAVPHWGCVQSFANDIMPPISSAPYRFPSAEFTAQCEEILSLYANLTDTRKMIAEYWSGGPGTVTPPGIWNRFAQFISRRDNYDVDKDVKLYFLLNAAMFDASVVCWGAKRYFNSVRPISAIRYLYGGRTIKSWVPFNGTQEMQGEFWKPYQEFNFVTPPFPDFTSGHSTFSGAAATILKALTGGESLGFSVTLPKGSSVIEPGFTPTEDITLFYKTFQDAANDAGISRLYGGIHFTLANQNGLRGGEVVANNVLSKGLNLINGQAFSRSSNIKTSESFRITPSIYCVLLATIFGLIYFLF